MQAKPKILMLVAVVSLVAMMCPALAFADLRAGGLENGQARGSGSVLATQSASVSNPRVVADSSMECNQLSTWDCVWFGSYPQTEAVPSDPAYASLQSASWDASGDATVGGAKYRRISKRDATTDIDKYPTDTDTWPSTSGTYRYFKYEPVKWRVLSVSGGTAFAVSDIALDSQRYNSTEKSSVSWTTSSIRSWLNGYGASSNQPRIDFTSKNFIGAAFSPGEQSAIVPAQAVNGDKVLLLAHSEVSGDAAPALGFSKAVRPDFSDDAHSSWVFEDRKCKGSDFAEAMGVGRSVEDSCVYWWVRSKNPDYSYNSEAVVADIGRVYENVGTGLVYYNRAVRPALYLDLSSPYVAYAGTVSSNGSVNETAAPGGPSAFTIGRDTNQYTNSNSRKSGGFFGWRNYRMTKALRERMQAFILANSGNPKADVIDLWDGELSEWGGSCFGMASTMSLLYGDAVEPADLSPGTQASSYYGIGSTNGNAAFAHAVNYYHLSQRLSTTAFDVYCKGNVMDAVNAYNEIQIAVGKDGPGVFCYYYKGQDGKSHGHAVVACGVERYTDGSFSLQLFDGNTYSGDSQGSFKRITVRPLELSVEGEGISPQSFSSFGYVGIGGLIPAKPYGGNVALATQAAGAGAGQSVSFGADSTFELSLADGSTVAYGGGELTGPAQVTKFAVCESGDGKGSVRLYADIGSDAAVEGVDSVDGELDVAVSSEGTCFSVEGSGVDGVSVDGAGRLDVDVDDRADGDVTVYMASESEVYRLSGAAAEDMTITAREDGCSVTATGGGAAVPGISVQAYSDYAAAEPGASRFTDVGYGSGHPHWVVDDGGIDWLSTAVDAGLMGGYRGTSLFGPDDPITRGQVATVLYRASAADASDTTDPARYAANATPFSDVAGGQYYTAAMNWAYAERIFTGDANGVTVRPGDGITRQELALVLYRYAAANGGPALADASCFSGAPDAADVSAWASAGVAWCYENGIMTGSASTRELSPWGGATRAAMCKMAVVTLGLLGDA